MNQYASGLFVNIFSVVAFSLILTKIQNPSDSLVDTAGIIFLVSIVLGSYSMARGKFKGNSAPEVASAIVYAVILSLSFGILPFIFAFASGPAV